MLRLRRALLASAAMGSWGEINRTLAAGAIVPTLGAELIVNTTFTTDTWWAKNIGVTISGGTGNYDVAAAAALYRNDVVQTYTWYRIAFDVAAWTSGAVRSEMTGGNATGVNRGAVGTYAEIVRNLNSTDIGLKTTGAAVLSVDNASWKAVTFSTCLMLLGNIERSTGTWQCTPTVGDAFQAGMALNYADENNLVLVYVNRVNGKAYLDKRIGGTWTTVISGNITYGAGKVLKVIASGTDYSLYYDGVQIGSTTAIADAGLGTRVYGFATDDASTPGTVTTSKAVS